MTERPEGLDDLLDFVAANMSDSDEDVLAAVRHLYATLNEAAFMRLDFRGSTVAALMGRITDFERMMPCPEHGEPEHYDEWLKDLIPDDQRLKFYQWIGHEEMKKEKGT